MPAASDRGGCALAVPDTKAYAIAIEEGRIFIVAKALTVALFEALTNTEVLADAEAFTYANCNPNAKTSSDPEAFSDPETFAIGEARRRAGQCRG